MDIAVRSVVWAYFLLFVFASLGKLDGWRGWSAITADLPFPSPVRLFVRAAVPLAEAAVAVVLVTDYSLGLGLAALLMGVLGLGVAAVVPGLGGKECNCFGAAVPTRIGYRLAIRNGALALLALAVWRAADPQDGETFRTVDFTLLPLMFVVVLMLSELVRFARRFQGPTGASRERDRLARPHNPPEHGRRHHGCSARRGYAPTWVADAPARTDPIWGGTARAGGRP